MIENRTEMRGATHLRELWAQDRPAFGLWSLLADPVVAELVAGTDLDFAVVDLQHGFATFSELPTLLQAMRSGGMAPIVRVPWNEPAQIMRAADSGAAGVLVPMVNSAAEAAAAVDACRFPPQGSRSWGPMWGGIRADGAPAPETANAALLCFVMVETQYGIEAMEEIVAVPGVDGVFIGPNDLALSCGHGRATYRDSDDVARLLDRVIAACTAGGVVPGLFCSDGEMALHWAGRGARFLSAGVDTGLLRAGADALSSALAMGADRTR